MRESWKKKKVEAKKGKKGKEKREVTICHIRRDVWTKVPKNCFNSEKEKIKEKIKESWKKNEKKGRK